MERTINNYNAGKYDKRLNELMRSQIKHDPSTYAAKDTIEHTKIPIVGGKAGPGHFSPPIRETRASFIKSYEQLIKEWDLAIEQCKKERLRGHGDIKA